MSAKKKAAKAKLVAESKGDVLTPRRNTHTLSGVPVVSTEETNILSPCLLAKPPAIEFEGEKTGPHQHYLISVSGKDKPGISTALLKVIGEDSRATLRDWNQLILHGRLTLYLVVEIMTSSSCISELLKMAATLEVALQLDLIDPVSADHKSAIHPRRRTDNFVLTVVKDGRLLASILSAITELVSRRGGNITEISRLDSKKLQSLELYVDFESIEAESLTDLKEALYVMGASFGCDIAFQKNDVLRYYKRMVVFDMDSTLIQGECIDEIAKFLGVEDKVSAITRDAMEGKIDFAESLRQRVALLKGVSVDVFDEIIANLKYTAGAKELCGCLRQLGYKLTVISGGFTDITDFVKEDLGLNFAFANRLERGMNDKGEEVLTGRVLGTIVDAQRKADLLSTLAQQEGIEYDQVIAIGDGANDIPMLTLAGLGIAFHAKPRVQQAAKFRMNTSSLLSVMFLLGMPDTDVEALLRQHERNTVRTKKRRLADL